LKKENNCVGVVVRANVQTFVSDNNRALTIKHNTRLNILQKKSCPGCRYCGSVLDSLCEISGDWPVDGIGEVEHGKLYELISVPCGYDYETGMADDHYLCLRPFDETTDQLNKKG
jgi:hypothetical protein